MSNLNAIKKQFISALKGYYSVKEKLSEAYQAAKVAICGDDDGKEARAKLRETLVAWGKDGGLEEKTVANTVSALMLADGLALRTSAPKLSKEKRGQIAELIEFAQETLELESDKEIASLFLSASRFLKGKSAGKGKKSEE